MRHNIYLIFYFCLLFEYVYTTRQIDLVKQSGSLLSTNPIFIRPNETRNVSSEYTLIVTTSLPKRTGEYLITIRGPFNVSLSLDTKKAHKMSALVIVLTTVFSIIGLICIPYIIWLIGHSFHHRLLIHRYKRQNEAVVRHTSPSATTTAAVVVVANNEIPLTIPVISSVEVSFVEEKLPPPYIEEDLPNYDSICNETMTTRL